MMSVRDKCLGVGDRVNVYWVPAHQMCGDAIIDAEIVYTPCATGDCFKLIDKSGKKYNVQHYDYMEEVGPTCPPNG